MQAAKHRLLFTSMQPCIETHLPKLADLCRLFRVRRLALFGSAARVDFDPVRSDVDLIAEFEDTSTAGYVDRYLDFAQALEKVLGRRVDLITPRSIANPFFAAAVKRDQVVIYGA